MNNYRLTIIIKAGSQELRERIIDEINTTPEGDKYYCRYFFYKREGESDIRLIASYRGGINAESSYLWHFHNKYSEVTEEVWLYVEGSGVTDHHLYNKDGWEDVCTLEDQINDLNFYYDKFTPDMLELHIRRTVYDRDNNLVLDEHETAPFPPELMSDDIRRGYEEWKADPEKWEQERQQEEEERKRAEEEWKKAHPSTDDDDLPF